MDVTIRRLDRDDDAAVSAAGTLFDDLPDPVATRRFLAEPTHHLLVAYAADGAPVGFVSGVETTHPDKGTEMFLYELGVAEEARGGGVGRTLVRALARLAEDRGCYGMWTATEPDNEPALRTYAAAGADVKPAATMLEWRFADRETTPG